MFVNIQMIGMRAGKNRRKGKEEYKKADAYFRGSNMKIRPHGAKYARRVYQQS